MLSTKFPLRKKLKILVDKKVQKQQDDLGQNSKHCPGIKNCVLPVDSNAEQLCIYGLKLIKQ